MDQAELQLIAASPLASENLRILIESGILQYKRGSIIVHYDADGRIRKVENHAVSFQA